MINIKNEKVKRRWMLLRDVLRNKKKLIESGLKDNVNFDKIKINETDEIFQEFGIIYKRVDYIFDETITIHALKQVSLPTYHDLQSHKELGIDNTGNVCIWPAEILLAYYLYKNKEIIENKTILELGAGMSGIAGLICSKLCNNDINITITDGNPKSVETLKMVSNQNNCNVSIEMLQWSLEENVKYKSQFDLIIGADILFFEEYHKELLNTLKNCIKSDGIILLLNPTRGNSSKKFIDIAKESMFNIEIKYDYNEDISQWRENNVKNNPSFDIDKDYPILYILKAN